jgi:O-antigen/teichoic acid export membrane protein
MVKDFQRVEKAIEMTATFLIPFILSFILFVASSTFNASSKPGMGYFFNLFNNLILILLIVSTILTWFFMALYYLESCIPAKQSLQLTVIFSGIAIVLATALLVAYSNFFKLCSLLAILGFILILVITYCALTIGRIRAERDWFSQAD